MSLTNTYKAFLARPQAAALSDKASLHYITTLTSINTATAIDKHFHALEKVLKRKQEKVLDAVEAADSLCVEVETTLEFLTGGGAYLPNLDENFLTDRVVIFPIIHIVAFDAHSKIRSIRLHWDQGSLLKQVEVIGSRARAWPIRDGKDQARLIANTAATRATEVGTGPSTSHSTSASTASPTKTGPRHQTATKDPHASLSLFTPGDEDEARPRAAGPGALHKPPPREYHELFAPQDHDENHEQRPRSPHKDQSAKPPPRDYQELFVGNESDASSDTKEKMQSPTKGPQTPGSVAPKVGAGKNYQPNRLFDHHRDEAPGSPTKHDDVFKKPDPTRYNHFEFGDGEDAKGTKAPQPPRSKTKHQSQWDFEDVVTPEKANRKIRSQEVRHFGLGAGDEELDNSPAKHPVARARPDARANFEFEDDGTPAGNRRPPGHPRGQGQINTGEGLYQDHVLDDRQSPSGDKKTHPLATVTNIKDRSKDFDPHFHFTDSPENGGPGEKKTLGDNKARAVKMMNSQWEAADHSPAPEGREFPVAKGKENFSIDGFGNKNMGIPTAGDGMGSKRGTSNRDWMFGGEDDGPKFQAARKQHAPPESHWDF